MNQKSLWNFPTEILEHYIQEIFMENLFYLTIKEEKKIVRMATKTLYTYIV